MMYVMLEPPEFTSGDLLPDNLFRMVSKCLGFESLQVDMFLPQTSTLGDNPTSEALERNEIWHKDISLRLQDGIEYDGYTYAKMGERWTSKDLSCQIRVERSPLREAPTRLDAVAKRIMNRAIKKSNHVERKARRLRALTEGNYEVCKGPKVGKIHRGTFHSKWCATIPVSNPRI